MDTCLSENRTFKIMSSQSLHSAAEAGTAAAIEEIKELLNDSIVNVNGKDSVRALKIVTCNRNLNYYH